jgi:predicted amidohydrolase YtcJ
MWGIHAAVTRKRQDQTSDDPGWYPKQRININQAFSGYIDGPSFAAGSENYYGKLAPGYLADLIMFDRDPFSYPTEQLYKLSPIATMVGGEWVWRL